VQHNIGSTGQIDRMLVMRALQHRRGGATGLVERYRGTVESRLRKLVQDAELARDLAQETFLRAFRSLHRLRHLEQFCAWLMTIAWRTQYTWRRASRTRVAPTDPAVLDGLPQVDEDVVYQQVANKDIWSRLEKLPAPYRLTLSQRYRLDMSIPEIAQRQGISMSLAKFRLRRGHHLMRKVLGDTMTSLM
jgi:RNA polymerase sigma-70 factor (ECF subfamily)